MEILNLLDSLLKSPAEIVLYGRAALLLGFDKPPLEFALSRDVDVVLHTGQAEALLEKGDFWQAVELVNELLADKGLYIAHFFTEDQVVLRPDWRKLRERINGPWSNLKVFRLADIDLLLSKLMRYDPIDIKDALFIISRANLSLKDVTYAIKAARVPDIPEIKEQVELMSNKILASFTDE